MDPFADLVRGVRADGALLGHSVLTPPWSVRYVHEAELTLCAALEGSSWVLPVDGEPVRLAPNAMAVVRGPEPFVVADEPGRQPVATVRRGELCTVAPSGEFRVDSAAPAPLVTGDGATLVVGAYRAPGEVGRRLLDALPPALVVSGESVPFPELKLFVDEVCSLEPGQQVVLDRLLDLLLVCTLRAWFAHEDTEPPAWFSALGDPMIGPVLRAMHAEPGRPWTVVTLAKVAGASRAAFARRFTALVGEPPLAYLTGWRMTLAADLLRRQDTPVASVASQVGYADGFAFSAAFKRVRGVSPSVYRAG
ncbi:AraC family transcriptional regulator [Amycolatopsis orientalis]|uniref:AraC family transcriptional regulator n=1 Tax=Amycolatopsis orientalis TaxID=31958 RepID=A0A193C185_AMYOR|nr:AraC family transcriptional regulator [Amycolatopsis orientalis]ANN18184.1 AraC family transcriptional regulator [Amycolatopsis orientalis]